MKITDKLFIVSYAIYYIASIWNLSYLPPVFKGKVYTFILFFCLTLLVFKEIIDAEINVKQFVLLFILVIYGSVVLLITGDKMLSVVLLYIFSARNIDFVKIAKITLLLSFIMLTIISGLAFGGFIRNEISENLFTERSRLFMGFTYVLYPSCIVGNMSAIYVYIRKEKIKWIEILGLLIFNVIIYLFTDSRLVFLLSVMLVLYIMLNKTCFKSAVNSFMIRKMLSYSIILSSVISIYVTYNFNISDPYQFIINFILEDRLQLGQDAINTYGWPLMGTKIEWIGNGRDENGLPTAGIYNYVDCAYIKMMLDYGVILLIAYLVASLVICKKMEKKNQFVVLVILSSIALHGMIDDLILKLHFNTFLLLFAELIPKINREHMKYIEKKLIENVFSLLTLKGAEYVVQFITLPYLLRVLGPERYGAIIFAQVIVNYGILFVDYGFNITAPRDIAKVEKTDIGQEFSSIYCAKLCLMCCVLIIGIFLTVLLNFKDILLLLCVLPALIGNVIFPIWFFQGIQQMRFITIFNLIARFVSVIGIFSLVNDSSDYYLAALFQSSVPVLAGCISLRMIYKKYPIVCVKPKLQNVRKKIYEGWDVFISTVFINLYTNTNVFLLGALTNTTVVGYYSAASKLIDAVKGIMAPVSNAIFPHVSLLFKESKGKAIVFLCKVLHFTMGVTFVLSLMTFFLSEQLVSIIMGSTYAESINILRIISFLPFIVGMSNIFGIQTMVAFGMQRMFSRILMFSALLNFIMVGPMIYMWNGIGLAITVVIVESFVTITMYIVLRRNNIILQ